MKALLLGIALLSPALAQNAGDVFKGGVSPTGQAQLLATLQSLTQKPVVLSTSVQDAANAILNENAHIEGVVGPLPQTLAAALERAAIRTPVRLIVASRGEGARYRFTRVGTVVVNAAATSTSIATSQGVIVVQGTQVTLLRAPLAAASVEGVVTRTFEGQWKAKPGAR